VLYDIGTGLEVLSPLCPQLFLEMAGLGNFAKVHVFIEFLKLIFMVAFIELIFLSLILPVKTRLLEVALLFIEGDNF